MEGYHKITVVRKEHVITMKTGIVGSGMIVREFLENIPGMEGLKLMAICGTPRREAYLQELCKSYGIRAWYTDYDAMLTGADIEVVYVAVPNHLHYEFCRKAILAGKHVICEKPFTSNSREAEALAQLADDRNVLLLEAVSTRYLPNLKKIRELLPELGKIRIVTANYSQYSSRYDAFQKGEVLPVFDPRKSGGALMDLNIYNISLMADLFGAPKEVHYAANMERGIDTSGILTMNYGTFQCVCIGAKDCKAPVSTCIQGDRGCICISTPVHMLSGFELYKNEDSKDKLSGREGGRFFDYNEGKHRMYHEFREFVRIVHEKDRACAKKMLEATLTAMEIQTRARQSAGIVFDADLG